MTALHRDNLGETSCNVHRADADPASKVRGEISVIFGSQVSWQVHYCKRGEVYFTTLLWPNKRRQNGLISRMLFSEFYKIMVNKVCLGGAIVPVAPPGPVEHRFSQLNAAYLHISAVLHFLFRGEDWHELWRVVLCYRVAVLCEQCLCIFVDHSPAVSLLQLWGSSSSVSSVLRPLRNIFHGFNLLLIDDSKCDLLWLLQIMPSWVCPLRLSLRVFFDIFNYS